MAMDKKFKLLGLDSSDDEPLSKYDDVLLVDNQRSFPKHTIWRPAPLYSLVLPENDYSPFDRIVRTVHREDYDNMKQAKRLIPGAIRENTHTHLYPKHKGLPGNWFGIYNPANDCEHNWYGNVNLIIDFQKCLECLGKYFIYFVDAVDFRYSTAIKLLITTDKFEDLKSYDPTIRGGPWYRDDHGRNWYSTNCRRFRCSVSKECAVEIYLVIGKQKEEELWRLMTRTAANHAEANDQGLRKCKKHRTGQNQTKCPSPFSLDYMAKLLIDQD